MSLEEPDDPPELDEAANDRRVQKPSGAGPAPQEVEPKEGDSAGRERLGQLPVFPAFLRRSQTVGRDDARRPEWFFLRRLRNVEHGRDPVVSDRNPDRNFDSMDRRQREETLLVGSATVEIVHYPKNRSSLTTEDAESAEKHLFRRL
ncbi:MAG: hypothetical protein A2V83_10580 [Nitrospirae bacterium RBG_16_64_22]|nr:MAG: hypothetical protein A2V83_10580 [Nitrospirae bacterium RBG_16_64_22]